MARDLSEVLNQINESLSEAEDFKSDVIAELTDARNFLECEDETDVESLQEAIREAQIRIDAALRNLD